MKSRTLPAMIASLMVLALLAGCRNKEKPDQPVSGAEGSSEAHQEAPPSPLYALYMAVDSQLQSGDQAGATKTILEALEDEKYATNKADLFTTVVRFLIHTGQLDEARTRFLNMIRTEPELAEPGFDLIYGHYVREGDPAVTLAWVRELLQQPLTPAMKRPATEWLLVALLEADAAGELLEKFPPFLEEFSAEEAAQVSRRLCSLALKSDRHELLEKLVASVAASGRKDDPALRSVALETRLMSQAGRGLWNEVEQAFPEALEGLSDNSLQLLFTSLAQAAARGRQFRTLDALAEAVLGHEGNLPGARNAAAREWVDVAVAEKNPALVPERIAALLEHKLPPRQIYEIFNRHLYALTEHPEALKAMLVQADVLSPLLEDDQTRNALHGLILDAAFMVEDYDRALAMLEKGIPDRDRDWHTMAITKVRAHKALQEKNIDEAVREFRSFMVIVANSGRDSPDPASNVVHTRDMILGRNAKRIGDIYREAGRSGEARVAYAEARLFYGKALEGNTAGEETEKLIRAELAEVPAE